MSSFFYYVNLIVKTYYNRNKSFGKTAKRKFSDSFKVKINQGTFIGINYINIYAK